MRIHYIRTETTMEVIMYQQFNSGDNKNEVKLPCHAIINSEQYIDYIVPYKDITMLKKEYPLAECIQIINETFAIIHVNRELLLSNDPKIRELIYHDNPYYKIPNLYGDYDLNIVTPNSNDNRFYEIYGKLSLSAAEIFDLHHYTFMPLTGKDVIIGVIDSGIDFTHPAFVHADNTTKILSIWDQSHTIPDKLPKGFLYGTEYTDKDLNLALQTDDPLDVVPSVDASGHGTFLAGISAGLNVDRKEGSIMLDKNFVGAAPDAELMIVKLKPAKKYIQKYYLVNSSLPVYQSTDVMMAIKYLKGKAKNIGKPIVICIGFGTNHGGHDGNSVLELYLDSTARELGNCIVVAAGNEADTHKHYTGNIEKTGESQRIKIDVKKGTSGFVATVWTYDIMTVAITSPTGETISRIPLRRSFQDEIGFLLENTKIFIKYSIFEMLTGGNLISIRFDGPTDGEWNITIYGDFVVSGRFDVWLTRSDLMASGAATFLEPDASTTITEPSSAGSVLTVGAYNPEKESLYIASGRGLTRDRKIKPDLVAPGVHVLGPISQILNPKGEQYGTGEGTSLAAAITAGASALLLQWGMGLQGDKHMNTQKIKNYLALGASNPENAEKADWGYGKLKLMSTFEKLKQISNR